MKSSLAPAVVALFGLLVLTGCDGADTDRESDEPATETAADEASPEAIDDIDGYFRSDDWPDEAERIVSMAPNVTELLFALELGDRLQGVTRYCDWPEEVEDLPKIGGMLDPDYEAILGAEPDVVVGVVGGIDDAMLDRFERSDIAYGFVDVDDLASITTSTRRLGNWFGVDDRAEEVVDDFERDIDEIADAIAGDLPVDDPSVLFIVDREPIVAAGPGSFGDNLIDRIGLQNALDDDADDYPILDIEKILDLNPELIIDTTVETDETAKERFWQQFDTLDAVDSGHVIDIDDEVMLRPGPRVPRALEQLGSSLESL